MLHLGNKHARSIHTMEDTSAGRYLPVALHGSTHRPCLSAAYRTNDMVVSQANDALKRNAEQNLMQQAEAESARVVSYLNDAVIRTQMVVQALQFQKYYAEENLLSSEVLRGEINQTMRATIDHADHILAGYAIYLPDALDAEDANT